MLEEMLKRLDFDKTKRGKVISVSGTTCIVKIDGEKYTCKLRRGISIEPNDIVFVKFPQNSNVDRYVETVLGGNETPEHLVISAEEILEKLKTVDGEGSGLDADMLDGKHSSEYATKEDIEDISIDGDTIVQNINTSTSIIDDKNLSANINDSISKKHDHSNKSILDTITQALIDGWNNAVAHISDKIKHITSSERALWNTVSNKSDKGHTHMESDITNLDKYTKAETDTKLGTKADKTYVDNELANKVDKITGKGLSTEDYTTAEKTKLSNIEDGAEKNKVNSVNSKTGDVVINKADIGLGDVENKSSTTIRNEITKTNVTNALGYTPENSSNKGAANGYAPLDSNIKIPLTMLPDIAKQQTYVVETIIDRDNLAGLIMGEKCYITTSGDSYIWDGTKWVTLAKADWENVNLQWTNIIGKPQSNVADIDDATSKRHTHDNKSIIDIITQTLIDRWNSAWNHISDAVRHITSDERTKWNTVDNKADTTYVDTELNKKVDRVSGKQLSTEDYTTIEKNKLANIEDGANKYIHPATHPAGMITESTARRFVSDTEKANWNGKAEISDIPTKVGQLENDKNYVTQEELGDAGYGDMLKSIYDTNSDGVVDKAEIADSVEWSNIQNKPSTFPPSNHSHNYIPLSSNANISGVKTFTDELKVIGVENFDSIYIKKTLGSGQVGTIYANLPLEIKNGGYHRFWKISFPSGASFWGKIKITLLGGYSSFNASGQMAKEINVNFNTGSMYSNVGSYTELSGYVEKDFRISEAIWNTETSQWEFWIYSHQLQGNNVPYIFIEAWAKSLLYINHAKNITLDPQPLFLQDTLYQNVKGNTAGQTLTKKWGDLPTYQHPYGDTIAVIDDIPTKFYHVGATPPTSNNLLWIDTSL